MLGLWVCSWEPPSLYRVGHRLIRETLEAGSHWDQGSFLLESHGVTDRVLGLKPLYSSWLWEQSMLSVLGMLSQEQSHPYFQGAI